MISNEDADRIAQAHTRELGRNLRSGCGMFLALFLVATVVLTVLLMLAMR